MSKKTTCWPDELVEDGFHPMKLLIFISQLHRRKMDDLFRGTGLHRAQHRMLMTLSTREFNSQSELAAALEVSTATVAVSLKKLERDGYIRKSTKEKDSRANFVQLTEKGRKVVADSREIFEYIDRESLRGFGEQDISLLCQFLERIYDNLSEIHENKNGGEK